MTLIACVIGFIAIVVALASMVGEGYDHIQMFFLVMGVVMILGGLFGASPQ